MDNERPVRANSPAFEYVYVANQRCTCGGYFKAERQELRTLRSGPQDRLIARCQACGEECSFDFDIESFFGEFEKYSRFHQTDDRFREAMTSAQAGELTEAVEALRLVVDEEEGEPNFAWAHYHLGLMLSAQGQHQQALDHLRRAAEIQPSEPLIQQGLGEVLRETGQEEAAGEHLAYAAELRECFGEESPSK